MTAGGGEVGEPRAPDTLKPFSTPRRWEQHGGIIVVMVGKPSLRAYLGLDAEVIRAGAPGAHETSSPWAGLSPGNHSPPVHFFCVWITSYCRSPKQLASVPPASVKEGSPF